LPKPEVYVVPEQAPNAFATGRDPEHSCIAVTQGLLDIMNRVELEGVIGHELSHVRDRDILLGTVVATLVGAVVLVSEFFLRFWWIGGTRSRSSDSGGDGGGVVGLVLLVVGALDIGSDRGKSLLVLGMVLGSLGGMDTAVRRLDDAVFNDKGEATTRIQLLALSLASVKPIETSCGQYDVKVSLIGEQPVTTMKIFRTEALGGTYSAPLALNVKAVFTPVDGDRNGRREVTRRIELGPGSRSVWAYVQAPQYPADVKIDTDGDGRPDTLLTVDGIDLVVAIDLDGDRFADQVLRIGPDAGIRERPVDAWFADPDDGGDQ
jgi:hypothetical protein